MLLLGTRLAQQPDHTRQCTWQIAQAGEASEELAGQARERFF
jgi:hypothetical protein